jgi:hypothetical protein
VPAARLKNGSDVPQRAEDEWQPRVEGRRAHLDQSTARNRPPPFGRASGTSIQRLTELRTSGLPVTIARLNEAGRQVLTTVPGSFFSLQWVKQNYGGGRFLANDIEFLIAGPPKLDY